MGVWGAGLYQNDTSEDIRSEFKELYNSGKDVHEITDQLLSDNNDILNDSNEAPFFWFALADTQWKHGVLLPMVKEKALWWIEHEKFDINAIFPCPKKRNIKRRQEVLLKLKEELLSPLPKKKKPYKRLPYKCEWQIGDVFAYRLESDLAKDKGVYGRYLLLQKIDEDIWEYGSTIPIVYVKITADDKIPTSEDEYNGLEFVQTSFSKYEHRFWPLEGLRMKEDIEAKSKINYVVDDYGYLPEYRVVLLHTSKRVIPKNLIYVGRFENIVRPKNEFVPHIKFNILHTYWQNNVFEEEMIKSYFGHNRRENPIYKRQDQ